MQTRRRAKLGRRRETKPLDRVDVGRPVGLVDTGEGANLRVLPPGSHTHARTRALGWEMCVG